MADVQPPVHDAGPSGFWALRSAIDQVVHPSSATSHPLSEAEIETNAPYQPFHTDRRVQIFSYENPQDSLGQYPEPWAFGEDIATHLLTAPRRSDDSSPDEDGAVHRMEKVMHIGEGDDQVEQIVVTTRRRKRVRDDQQDELDDGFFEDDCEVLDFATDRV
jgi:hypothetical protein